MLGLAGAGDIEGRAVIDAGANEGQADRDVHATLDAEILHGDEALVVILRHDDVELTPARPHEDRIAWPRPAGLDAGVAGGLDRRRDLVDVLAPEHAAFAGMRIEAGHGDARARDAVVAASALCQPDRPQDPLLRHHSDG